MSGSAVSDKSGDMDFGDEESSEDGDGGRDMVNVD